ncbi:hypothetical protein AXG93_2912s1370 [Marchantia polymorpha subsp. ruderalis]|uniref:Uncharacterized protein n=1 Tax=Marchantia polymorpha subsp. ruderalis TaxID=1480154 RepID=A0A176WG95_MARPO|nr:hypothetical protein AXG93_2912s1370 [Marchantia polymorpha subsp. ruderalis]
MPVVPAPGEYTVCEINRDLLTRKDDADKTAQDAYSKILGRVFASIPFRVNLPENGFRNGLSASYYEDEQARESGMSYYDSPMPSTSDRRGDMVGEEDGRRGFLSKQLSVAKNYISSTLQGVVAPYPEGQASFKSDRFQAVSWHKQKHWLAFISSADQVLVYDFEDSESRDPAVLASDSQRGVEAVEWRPNSGATLSVACRGGICIWSASFPGNIAPVRAGIVSILGTPHRGSGARDGSFNLWETNTWTSEPWSSAGGSIVSAMWGPDGHALLAAFDGSTTLATLYFPSRPPSLDVHLLPLELPELESVTGGRGTIEKMAWDGTGERLALSYSGGDATYGGLIAIYDTRHSPLVSSTFIAGVLAFVVLIRYFFAHTNDLPTSQTQNKQ